MNSQEYYDWLSKFETKKTTDDTFTPPAVYDVVVDYVNNHIVNLDGLKVVRPFYPNGDYTDLSQYDDNSIVIDNPPFSIMSQICQFYQQHGIQFFLFAPALVVFSAFRLNKGLTAIIASATIEYANGAKVPTNFITNLTPHLTAKTAPELHQALQIKKANLPKYQYPANVVMVNTLQKLVKNGLDFEVSADNSCFISQLDSQKASKKTVFGGGLLVCDNTVKALQNKVLQNKVLQNKAIVWQLSQNERQLIKNLAK